jgi:hypothetical protein
MIQTRENPTPRWRAGDRVNSKSQHLPHNTKPASSRDFAAVYVARRYRLPLPIAAVVRLAKLGGALS